MQYFEIGIGRKQLSDLALWSSVIFFVETGIYLTIDSHVSQCQLKESFFSFLKCYHLTIHKAHQRGTKVKVKDVMRHHANSKPWSVYWRRKLKWCLWWLLTYNSFARTRRDSCFVFIYCPGLICIFMVNAFILYWVMCLYTFFYIK